MAEYGTKRRPRRRGRGLLITLLVLLIIIVIVLVVGDRVGRSYAERLISDKVAEQVRNQKATSEKPDVTIEGFPFLTQVAKGQYDEVKIELANFSGPSGQGDQKISLPLLDVRARTVKAPVSTLRSGGSIVAGQVTGTGTIDYQQLVALIGSPSGASVSGLTLTDKNGALNAAATVSALGQSFKVTGQVKLAVAGNNVQVRFADLDSPDLPALPGIKALLITQAERLGFDVQIPALPLHLKLQKVQPEANGLQFTAGASNVTLNSGGI